MKIRVKNLGKIKSGEIEVKPLTVFVGKNGVNKSYMAHVVYGVAETLLDSVSKVLEKELSVKNFLW